MSVYTYLCTHTHTLVYVWELYVSYRALFLYNTTWQLAIESLNLTFVQRQNKNTNMYTR